MNQRRRTAGILYVGVQLILLWAATAGARSVDPPKLMRAIFTIEADRIQVDFDRKTLQGARPISTRSSGDAVFDSVDYSTQQKGKFDCSGVFRDATVLMLSGPSAATCAWTNPSRLRIHLAEGHGVRVGDRLVLRDDAIYSLPQGTAWSTVSAQGSIRIEEPSPLEHPVVVITGDTTIDEYSPAKLDGRGSFKVGGSATYLWSLANGTEDAPNPSDLCGNESRLFDKTKVQIMKDRLALLSEMNEPVLDVTADLVHPASKWRIVLNVTGRWSLTGSKSVVLRRLGNYGKSPCGTTQSTTTTPNASTSVVNTDDDAKDALVGVADWSPRSFQLSTAVALIVIALVAFLN